MSFANTSRSSSLDGDILCPLSRAKYSETSAPVEPLPLALALHNVITALTRASSFIRAETGIAQSVSPLPVKDGWPQPPASYYPFRTATLYSRCPAHFLLWPCKKRSWSITFCSAVFPGLAQTSDSETLLYIDRDKCRNQKCCTTRIYTVWFPPAVLLLIAPPGSTAGNSGFFRAPS